MSDDVVDRLRENGGPLAVAAADEIDALRERVGELTFCLMQAMADLPADKAQEVADTLEAHGTKDRNRP